MTEPPTVTLVIGTAEGVHEEVVLEPADPNKAIYIGVGEERRRGGVWRVWANKPGTGKSDVYVAPRNIAGVQKISLHETGEFRNQWVTADNATKFTGSPDKRIYIWQRGQEYTGAITKGLAIYVPAGELQAIPGDDRQPANTIWLPEPESGAVWGIYIVFARPDQGNAPLGGAMPLAGFTLANGSVLLVLAQKRHLTDEERDQLSTVRGQIALDQLPPDASSDTALRMTLHGIDENGDRHLWDLAAQHRLPDPHGDHT